MTEDEGAYLGFTGHRLLACPGERPGGLRGLLQVTKHGNHEKSQGGSIQDIICKVNLLEAKRSEEE